MGKRNIVDESCKNKAQLKLSSCLVFFLGVFCLNHEPFRRVICTTKVNTAEAEVFEEKVCFVVTARETQSQTDFPEMDARCLLVKKTTGCRRLVNLLFLVLL